LEILQTQGGGGLIATSFTVIKSIKYFCIGCNLGFIMNGRRRPLPIYFVKSIEIIFLKNINKKIYIINKIIKNIIQLIIYIVYYILLARNFRLFKNFGLYKNSRL
jgi:hypothetical protein